jgi:acyl-CoA thioesterase II
VPSTELPTFVTLLDLEEIDKDIFRGRCHAGAPLRAFGGQVAAQALVAAGRTVAMDERPVHSLHGYFLRPGEAQRPIVYLVERLRDGRSFTTRRVSAVQHGEVIFALSASFHRVEQSPSHQFAPPEVPDPDSLPPFYEVPEPAGPDDPGMGLDKVVAHVADVRFVGVPWAGTTAAPGRGVEQLAWMRANEDLPDDPLLHVCALTYLSDLTLASTADIPHRRTGDMPTHMASLDHAMWFHRPFRADDWLLFAQDSPSTAFARGLARGEFYTRDGQLVASAVQEAVIRRGPAR